MGAEARRPLIASWRASTGAIAGGLAATSIGVLVTVTLAGAGHDSAMPQPVRPTPVTGAAHASGRGRDPATTSAAPGIPPASRSKAQEAAKEA
jgi:hypothetical protein